MLESGLPIGFTSYQLELHSGTSMAGALTGSTTGHLIEYRAAP